MCCDLVSLSLIVVVLITVSEVEEVDCCMCGMDVLWGLDVVDQHWRRILLLLQLVITAVVAAAGVVVVSSQ